MNDPLDDESPDGLDCFEFRLFIDDLSASAKRKYNETPSPYRLLSRDGHMSSGRKLEEFENTVEKEVAGHSESNFRRVYELITENEEGPAQCITSEKKQKKGGKNLTPDTNYTQKEYTMWGSYRTSRDESHQSKRTLTAYSEAFEPDNLSSGFASQDQVNNVLEIGKAIRIPKKLSLAGNEMMYDIYDSPKPQGRKLSFQEKPQPLYRDANSRFKQMETRRTPKKRFSEYVSPELDKVFGMLSDQLDILISNVKNDQVHPVLITPN